MIGYIVGDRALSIKCSDTERIAKDSRRGERTAHFSCVFAQPHKYSHYR